MSKYPIEEKIIESGMTEAELEEKVKATIERMKGLINEETALYIIAKELGIDQEDVKKEVDDIGPQLAVFNDLHEDDLVFIEAQLVNKYPVKEYVSKKDGKKGRRQTIVLSDGTGTQYLTIWNQDIDRIADWERYDRIRISKAYVKKKYRGDGLEFGISKGAEFFKLSGFDPSECTPIADMKDKPGAFSIRGVIDSIIKIFTYEACTKCGRKPENCKCDELGKTEYRGIVKFKIGEEGLKATAFNEQCTFITGMEGVDLKLMMDESYSDGGFENLQENFKNMVDMLDELIFIGVNKYSDYSEEHEFNVNKIIEVEKK